jgi:tRNA(Ile)-lysidine synthase
VRARCLDTLSLSEATGWVAQWSEQATHNRQVVGPIPTPATVVTSTRTPQQIRETVRRYALEHGLLPPGPIVLAVSGGTDSTALLLLLADLSSELGLVLHVAHFDHRIRRTGASDAQYVSDLAASVGATIRVGRAERGPRSEDDARRARYAFLRRVAAERGATAIATGHTRDDQAETVLLHLTRGSGIAGLAAMRPSRAGIVRPILSIGRADTTEVCRAAGIAPREDPSNRSLRYARNRIRRRVLPELGAINPQVATALARLADAAAEVVEPLRRAAAKALEATTNDGSIDLDGLAGSTSRNAAGASPNATDDTGPDRPLRTEALALAWERATGRVLSAVQRDSLAAMADRRDGTMSLDLPGGRVIREYARLRIHARDGDAGSSRDGVAEEQPDGSTWDRAMSVRAQADAPSGDAALSLGRSVERAGWTIELLAADPPAGALTTPVPRADAGGLVVRSRRAGDRMAGPLGPKVQDLLTDAKVPVRLRSLLPVIATRDGTVAWIPGVASAWNWVSDGYVLVAHPPAAWRMPISSAGSRVASSEMGREGH